MNIYTIGFTKKSAEKFFGLIKENNIKRLVDVRLNNVSQLSGFAKRDDLKFFLKEVCRHNGSGGVEYVHVPDLAPTQEMLNDYRKNHKDWSRYEKEFLDLMEERKIETSVPRELIEDSCLLCSEDKPHHCHRRLVAEYLNDHWGHVEVKHLPAQ